MRRPFGAAAEVTYLRCASLATFALVMAALTAASANPISGYVIDGNTGTRVAGVEVAFLVTEGGQTREILRKPSDVDGRFSFSGPFISPGLEFALLAIHGGTSYPTTKLFAGNQKQIILEVFDSTDNPAAIRIAKYHLFLHLQETNLEVANLVEMENRDHRTFGGTGAGTDRRVAEFELPTGVFNLTGNLRQVESGLFVDNQPLPPGRTQLSFTYLLNPQDLVDGFTFASRYETEALEVYLQPSSLSAGEPFQDLGEVEFHDTRYRRLHLHGLRPGQSVLIPLPLTKPLRWLVKWATLGAALLGAVLVASLARSPSLWTAAEPAALAARLGDLLDQLARLDDQNSSAPDDPTYLRERAARMAEAADLRLRLQRRSG